MYGAAGESGGRRNGWDESDLIKFLRAETLKMIRREVREVQEDSEGGSGGRVVGWEGWVVQQLAKNAQVTSEWPPIAALVIGASGRLVGGKRFVLLRTSEHKRKEERKGGWHAFKQCGLISQLGSG